MKRPRTNHIRQDIEDERREKRGPAKLRVGKSGWWVHVCSTDQLTHYAAHRSRGRKALDAIGIAPQFRGTSVHDGLASYQGYRFTHAWCNVHHLRDLTFVACAKSGQFCLTVLTLLYKRTTVKRIWCMPWVAS